MKSIKMPQKIFFLILTITTFQINNLKAQDTIILSGKIYSPAMIGGGYRLPDTSKAKMKSTLDKIDINIIENYLIAIKSAKNTKDTLSAIKILEKEPNYKKGMSTDLEFGYLYAKTNYLGILFLPCVTIKSPEMKRALLGMELSIFNEINKTAWEGKQFTFKCLYLGEMVTDQTKIYKIITKL